MVALAYAYEPTFSDRVSELLNRVDYRLAETPREREAIFRLRYEAYRREGNIEERTSATFTDAYDERGNVRLVGVYVDGELASSIRIHIACRDQPIFPSYEPFSDQLDAALEAGKVIVDPTRFVTDKHLSKELTGLPHVTLRLAWLAVEQFQAEHFLVAIRPEHQAFYRRTFQHRLIVPARPYPLLKSPICLMTVAYRDAAAYVKRRYPFYRSTEFERRMLFGTSLDSAASGRIHLPRLRIID
jgi:N-acyl amino acid synthase FeeM